MGCLPQTTLLYLLPMMKLPLLLLILVAGSCLAQARADETMPFRLNNLSSIMERAREDAQKTKPLANKHAAQGQKAAQRTSNIFHSPEFQKQIQSEQQRLEQGVFKDYAQPWTRQKQKSTQERSGILSTTEKIYLFFSSSVPETTIQPYIAAISGTGDPNVIPVMRGFVKGMADMKASAEFFNRIVKKDLDCRDEIHPQKICQRFQVGIKVNPLLFTQYGINRVPAVVYARQTDAFIIQGDAGLDYLLEQINQEAKSTTLASLIKTMRGKSD
jgi:type-F conjugative transfer system pilin assembly protein TrbC